MQQAGDLLRPFDAERMGSLSRAMNAGLSDAVHIVPYDPGIHSAAVYSIWERCFGERWPITAGIWREVTEAALSNAEAHQLVATDAGGRILAYMGSELRAGKAREASIVLLMVDPESQRLGIGTRLLNSALETFRANQVSSVHLGAHAEKPFWNGIPACLPGAQRFFEQHGWDLYEKSYDLVADLRGFQAPGWVLERPRQHGACIRVAGTEDVPGLLSFLGREFADWRPWFVREVEKRGTDGILIAVQAEQVVGTLLMSDVRSTDWTGWQWRALLGEDMGAIGAVGVAESQRDKGIGLAMVAQASGILRDRGIRHCFIHWTWLVDWYGRLGYQAWGEYWMARKAL